MALLKGQGTFTVFMNGSEVVPPTSSPYTGSGNLILNGNSLSVVVEFDERMMPTTGFIHGPAPRGQNGPQLFDLGTVGITPGLPAQGIPGIFSYSTEVTLSNQQIADLRNSLFYINISSVPFSNGEIRGQITSVPEPSSVALFLAGSTVVFLFRRRLFRGT